MLLLVSLLSQRRPRPCRPPPGPPGSSTGGKQGKPSGVIYQVPLPCLAPVPSAIPHAPMRSVGRLTPVAAAQGKWRGPKPQAPPE